MIDVPTYLLPRPPMPAADILGRFDRLLDAALATNGGEIAYDLAAPKWQFLCHAVETRDLLLHGSTDDAIAEFEPRKSDDVNEFGNRRAVYAASDGIWPIYFAILDRKRHPMTLVNASARLRQGAEVTVPHYFFSISAAALLKRPFTSGTVYLLPRAGFEQQTPLDYPGGLKVEIPQWASPEAVRPLARLSVDPQDFPFLAQMRGHDDEETFRRARADPDGFPWLDEMAADAGG